jgi:hypothetical protein
VLSNRLIGGVSVAALFAALVSSAHAADTSVQWGADRTVSPWSICLYDSANACQSVLTLPASGGGALIPTSVGGLGINAGSATGIPSFLSGVASISTTLPSGLALGTIAGGNLAAGTGYLASNLSGLGTGVATLLGGTATGTGGPVGSTAPTFTGTLSAQAMDISGEVSATETASGSFTGNFSQVTVSMTDAVAATGFVYPGLFTDTMNSAAITGGRPGLTGQVIMEAPTSASNPLRFYAGMSGLFASSVPDNGVSGTPLGFGYGASANCTLQSGATFWAGCTGMNASVFVLTGASVFRRFGFQAESDGNLQGSLIDAAFDVWEGTGGVGPSWEDGLLVDNSNGVYPISAGGTILKAGTGAQNIALAAGVDLSEITGAWTFAAIALPANNGGICWGATSACGGGEIISQASSGGPQVFLQAGQFEIAFGSGGVLSANSAGLTTAFKLNISGIAASAGSGGLYVCVDSTGLTYKKSACP